MKIKTAEFIKSVTGSDVDLDSNLPQVAFIGRSNVGKSSVINSLTNHKKLAITSKTPGRTQQINLFLINRSFYLVDLPGYGYAKIPKKKRQQIEGMLDWYFFKSGINQKKIVLIIDAKVGPTQDDLDTLSGLEKHNKNIVIIANKIDKVKKSQYEEQFKKIQELIGDHKIIPYSAFKKIGIGELSNEIA